MTRESLSFRHLFQLLFCACLIVASKGLSADSSKDTQPNILFIISDDVGIDQWKAFGYGGLTPPAMLNIDTIANHGVRFRNNWSMPACSNSRATMFNGRFPLRSNVVAALGPFDLANSMVSPFDVTVPKLLKQRGYKSALFGKFHLGLQGNNPFGLGMPKALGWDYFWGWMDETGEPSSIDTTAGGVGAVGRYSCGFVPDSDHGGANKGACYRPQQACEFMEAPAGAINPPGRACRDSGGIFDPEKACPDSNAPLDSKPDYVKFSELSAHYVSPVVINHENGLIEKLPLEDIRARTFRGSSVIDAAIEWIKSQPKGRPWMASVSFSTAHTPMQQPPVALLRPDSMNSNGIDCASTSLENLLPLNNQMIEAMDVEIGRLLTSIGLARRNPDGSLAYNPKRTDTMIVMVNDNGSLGYTVKQPFDPNRAKGTPYQTGVWAPLVVSGPMVNKPDREVKHMTNVADLYELFGEMAGVNVHKAVSWPIDSKSMLPYLTNPDQGSIRKFNYTEIGLNLQANGGINGPCMFASNCSHIPVTKTVCEDNGGVWWGVGADAPGTAGPEGLPRCCDVQVYLTHNGRASEVVPIIPQAGIGIRNQRFKIVQNFTTNYNASTNSCVDTQTEELYRINERKNLPKLDRAEDDLLKDGADKLSPDAKANYLALKRRLSLLQKSDVDCPGDGNLDLRVDQKDSDEWNKFSRMSGGLSSWYDFNLDGLTNEADFQVIFDNFGKRCKSASKGVLP